MAQYAEFEEKEYENPLNLQLLSTERNNLWTPGQVFEKHFGIDAALFSRNDAYWRIFGYSNPLSGVILNDFRWGYLWRRLHDTRPLPNFKTNLLIQSKRPEHRAGRNMAYASHGIGGQYWLFDITPHQQKALEQLNHKLRNKVLVCYACAAFHKLENLYHHIRNNSLVENSTFVQVHKLTGHGRWIYNTPGMIGLGCSEIESINDDSFNDHVNNMQNSDSNANNPLTNLLLLESTAIGIMSELKDDNPLKSEYLLRYINPNFQNDIKQVIDFTNLDAASRAFYNFAVFCNLTNVNWFTL